MKTKLNWNLQEDLERIVVALVKLGRSSEPKVGAHNRGFTEFLALIELARLNQEPLELNLDDSDLYDVFLKQDETFVFKKSLIPGVVMGRYLDVEVHMSFREEDRPSYEGV